MGPLAMSITGCSAPRSSCTLQTRGFLHRFYLPAASPQVQSLTGGSLLPLLRAHPSRSSGIPLLHHSCTPGPHGLVSPAVPCV